MSALPLHNSTHVDLESASASAGGGGGGGDVGDGDVHRRQSSAGRSCGGDGDSCRSSFASEESRDSVSAASAAAAAAAEILEKRRESESESSVSEYSVEVVDLESGIHEGKMVHLSKPERDCRICHLSLDPSNQESGIPIELGCSCKADLAAAHKQCAEAWFKIKGNKICEICGSTARNVSGANEAELMEQWNEANDAAASTIIAAGHTSETRNFWQGHRFLNFLLACMVFAFVISWLFHFNVPS